MSRRAYRQDPPKQQAMVDARGRITQSWSAQFDALWRPSTATDVDVAYDPPPLAAGVYVRVNVPAQGARQGNFVAASFDPITQDVEITGWVSAANQVTVKFWNVSGAPVDLPAGTLRVRYWSHNP